MTHARRFIVLASLVAPCAGAVFVACVGDTATINTGPDSGTDAGITSDATVDGAQADVLVAADASDGGCGVTCSGATPVCLRGACVECSPGATQCVGVGGARQLCSDGGAWQDSGTYDLVNDPLNCGTCGHDCLGGGCSKGVCQPLLLATNQQNPRGIAVDSTTVYWTQGNNVQSCAIGGCNVNPTTLAAGQSTPTSIVVDQTNVYWSNLGSGDVEKCAVGGCGKTPTPLVSSQGNATSVFVDATNAYFTTSDSVKSCALGGCNNTPTTLASGQVNPYLRALDATTVYWATGTSILTCAKSGCNNAPTTFANGGTIGMVVDSKNVYWTATNGGQGYVYDCPVGGCGGNPSTLLSGLYNGPSWLVADANNLYFTTASGGGSVRTCGKAGCSNSPTVLATAQDGAQMIAQDQKRVYWVTVNSPWNVLQLAK